MKQLLSLLLAVMVMVPSGAFGLGLGKIERKSRVDEPFSAAIEIIGARADELAELTVKLADPGRFKNAGLDRPEALANLRFEVVQNELGSDYIKITSEEPIRESFLNFLIEVNWPKGRLYREYTVLLDTPVYEPGARKRRLAGSARTTSPGTPVETRHGLTIEQSGARETGQSVDAYGPTVRGDTLWEITAKLRADRSISVQQMMLALWHANPKAFFQDNVNALRKGIVLRIPKAAEASNLSKAEALALVQQHHVLWEEYRQRLASTASKRAIGTETSRGTAPGEEQPVIAGQPSDQLKLLAATELETQGKRQGTEAGAADQQINSLRHELELATEELESKRQEVASLKANLTEDESLIKDLKQQIEIKNAELAALQTKLTAQGQQAQVAEGSSPALPPIETTPPASATQDPGADVSTGSTPPTAISGQQVTGVQRAESTQEVAPPATEMQPKAEGEVLETTPEGGKGVLDSIPGGIITLIAAAVAILLAAFAVLTGKRQETYATPEGEQFSFSLDDLEEPVETERPIAERSAVDFDLAGGIGTPAATQAEIDETSIIRPERWEEDPLAEVNDHLANRRFEKAEELVKRTIEQYPDEPEYKLRLLEIYHAAVNKKAYEANAKALFSAVGGVGPLWDVAVAMWREMSPERALFEDETAPGHEHIDLSSADFIDITRADERAGLGEGAEFIDLANPEADFEAVDFNALEPGVETQPSDLTAINDLAEKESFGLASEVHDIELPEVFDITTDEPPYTSAGRGNIADVVDLTGGLDLPSAAAATKEDREMLDFFDVPLMEEISSVETGGGAAPDTSDDLIESSIKGAKKIDLMESERIEFDLADMTFEPIRVKETQGRSENPNALSDLSWLKGQNATFVDVSNDGQGALSSLSPDQVESDDQDLAYKFFSEPGELPPGSKQVREEGTEFSSLPSEQDVEIPLFRTIGNDTDSDENDTKLNLALTYIELGESEGARSILNEVVRVGTEEQKKEAEDLLKKLG